MKNLFKLTSSIRLASLDSQKEETMSPEKNQASPTKMSSPEKKQKGVFNSLVLKRPTENQFTFSINSFGKISQRNKHKDFFQERENTFQFHSEKSQKMGITQTKESSEQNDRLSQMTTAESNNVIFSKILLKEKQENDLEQKHVLVESVNLSEKNYEIKQNDEFIYSTQEPVSQVAQQLEQLQITDFQIGKKLGAGKFGQVYLARHKSTGFFCALKKIMKAKVDARLLIQLIREIKIQSYLNHPNIVKMYTFFADETHIYLVMELCYSGQLYSYLKKKRRLPEGTTKNIVMQVCKALGYMHIKQIIHRDLKPENIIYQSGLVKLCDFGWSIDTSTMRTTFCGTPLYASPQILKRKNYNNKIDIWSIGILTYELLFGKVPFKIQSQQDFLKIGQNEVIFSKNTNVSDSAKDFILNCLEKDPNKRYTVEELIEHQFLVRQQSPSISDMH